MEAKQPNPKKSFKLWPENHRAAVGQKPYGVTLEAYLNGMLAKALERKQKEAKK